MNSAFQQTFAGGAETVILIGSDIPDIKDDLLHQAFSSLLTKEVVIGPSQDGGYYLIGMTAKQSLRLLPLLFDKMHWSTKNLFQATMYRLTQAGFDVATLPCLRGHRLSGRPSFC